MESEPKAPQKFQTAVVLQIVQTVSTLVAVGVLLNLGRTVGSRETQLTNNSANIASLQAAAKDLLRVQGDHTVDIAVLRERVDAIVRSVSVRPASEVKDKPGT